MEHESLVSTKELVISDSHTQTGRHIIIHVALHSTPLHFCSRKHSHLFPRFSIQLLSKLLHLSSLAKLTVRHQAYSIE